jgi:hypothetical protein
MPLLRKADEGVGRDGAEDGVVPTAECLDGDGRGRRRSVARSCRNEVVLRLECDPQLAGRECSAQVTSELGSTGHAIRVEQIRIEAQHRTNAENRRMIRVAAVAASIAHVADPED